jgi:hypothetical protein
MLFIQKTRGIRVEVNEKQLLLDNWKKVRFFVVSEPDSRGALRKVQGQRIRQPAHTAAMPSDRRLRR